MFVIFDIETVPDLFFFSKLTNKKNLSFDDLLNISSVKYESKKNFFLPLYVHKIIAISVIIVNESYFNLFSIGNLYSSERDLIDFFYRNIIEKFKPILVSWNGNKFDLSVLRYRSLLYGISSPTYWDFGFVNMRSKWDNYLNKFHFKHLDLINIFSGYSLKNDISLNDLSIFLGFSSKKFILTLNILNEFKNGNIKIIRDYCNIDVINTYLIYLRFQLVIGHLCLKSYLLKCNFLKNYLLINNNMYFNFFF